MVYNGTKSGLNLVTWVPCFAIPSSATLKRMVVPGSVQADNDYEDMFLNFKLHDELQAYTGMDVTALLYKDKADPKQLGSASDETDGITVHLRSGSVSRKAGDIG
jgi:hypothetical protein